MSNRGNTQSGASEVFVTSPDKPWFVIAFLSIWLCGWTLGGVSAFFGFAESGQVFLLIWLAAWALGMAYAVSMLLWFYRGQQTVYADFNRVQIKTVRPWSTKMDSFESDAISHLQIDGTIPSQPFYMRANTLQMPWHAPGRIQFDYNGRTHSFGIDIDPAQGREIVARLRNALPETAFSGST